MVGNDKNSPSFLFFSSINQGRIIPYVPCFYQTGMPVVKVPPVIVSPRICLLSSFSGDSQSISNLPTHLNKRACHSSSIGQQLLFLRPWLGMLDCLCLHLILFGSHRKNDILVSNHQILQRCLIDLIPCRSRRTVGWLQPSSQKNYMEDFSLSFK